MYESHQSSSALGHDRSYFYCSRNNVATDAVAAVTAAVDSAIYLIYLRLIATRAVNPRGQST